jgi:uncharacterized membrane protein
VPRGAHGLRLAGHPVHAALAAFPIAFLSIAIVVDLAALFTGEAFWWEVAFWAVVAGLCAAIPTAGAGMIDLVAIDEGDPAMKVGTRHMSLMATAVGLFVIEVSLRGGSSPPTGTTLVATLALDGLGAALLVIGGFYGGELVFGHGVGVATSTGDGARDGAGEATESRSGSST